MSFAGRHKVSIYDRVEEFKHEGLYIFDAQKKEIMCRHCNSRIAWEKKSTVENHCKSQKHVKKRENANENERKKRQASLPDTLSSAKKAKDDKQELIFDTVQMFLKANIPLNKIDHPEIRKWLNKHVAGRHQTVYLYNLGEHTHRFFFLTDEVNRRPQL